MLVDKLIERFFEIDAKYRVEEFLKKIQEGNHLTSRELRTTDSVEDLKVALREAVNAGHLTVSDLADKVDELEESGNQHIFLFELTEDGANQLTDARTRRYKIPETAPVESAYELHPTDRLTWHHDRDGRLILKQVFTASFWQANSEESTRTEEREVLVYDRVKRRAVNFLVVHTARKRAEIRIARVEGFQDSDPKALVRFQDFLKRLAPFLDMERHLVATPIWKAFRAIASNREEVRFAWERATDPSATLTYSDRLLGRTGVDIRDHPDYRLSDAKWARKEVRPRWKRGSGPHAQEIATRLTEVELDEDVRVGKVEIAKVLDRDSLKYVIGRIRHFTSEASR
jgi:hypothetical protein